LTIRNIIVKIENMVLGARSETIGYVVDQGHGVVEYRTRYFTNSGVIGSREFGAENYHRFRHLFYSKHEKRPKPIKG
jgi:hypothetical protein